MLEILITSRIPGLSGDRGAPTFGPGCDSIPWRTRISWGRISKMGRKLGKGLIGLTGAYSPTRQHSPSLTVQMDARRRPKLGIARGRKRNFGKMEKWFVSNRGFDLAPQTDPLRGPAECGISCLRLQGRSPQQQNTNGSTMLGSGGRRQQVLASQSRGGHRAQQTKQGEKS